nr:hypothetical protein [Veillonella rogosae]
MMKRALMAALCFSFVTLGSQAIDINIPGADPTVSKDSYQTIVRLMQMHGRWNGMLKRI